MKASGKGAAKGNSNYDGSNYYNGSNGYNNGYAPAPQVVPAVAAPSAKAEVTTEAK